MYFMSDNNLFMLSMCINEEVKNNQFLMNFFYVYRIWNTWETHVFS